MNTTAAIQYRATSIPDLVQAIQAVQALGITPAVRVSPAPVAPAASHEEPGPMVKAYLAREAERENPMTFLRRSRDEKERGLSLEEAAAERLASLPPLSPGKPAPPDLPDSEVF